MILSLIIPIYNMEKYLYNTLASIEEALNEVNFEDKEKIEVLLLNDGSKDSTEEICLYFIYKNKNLKYIKKENTGCSDTRNYGIEVARGQYLWFIDSDDCIYKESLRLILSILKKERIEVLVFGHEQIRKNKRILKKIKNINLENRLGVYYDEDIIMPPWNKIYSKKIIEINRIKYPIDTHMGEDFVFNFKYFYYIKNIKVLDNILYKHYLVDSGVTANIYKQIDIFSSFLNIYKFIKIKKLPVEYLNFFKKRYIDLCVLNLYWCIIKNNKVNFREKLKEIKKVRRKSTIFSKKFLKKNTFFLELVVIIILIIIFYLKLNKLKYLKKLILK